MQFLPENWRMVKVADLISSITRKDPASLLADTFDYIDISAVDNSTKRIRGVSTMKTSEAPSRARQVVKSTDILVSTVRPALNAVAMVPDGLSNPIASTGFCVLRARSALLDSSYLFNFVVSKPFVQVLTSRQRGGSYPAVLDEDILSLQLPLPPLSEQQRIVEILHEAEEIRRLRAEAAAKASDLIPAAFHHFFGDAEDRFHSLPMRAIVEEFRYGTSRSSGDKGAVTLRIPNIVGHRISFDDLVKVDESDDSMDRLRLRTGDMLFVRTNGNPDYVGRCSVFDSEDVKRELGQGVTVIFASYLIRARLKLDLMRPWFLHAFLKSPLGRAKVLKQARTAAGQYNINTEGLGAIRVPVPPLEIQDQFLLEASETQQIAEIMRLSERQLEALGASLSAHAFSGQLTADWRNTHVRRLAVEARDRDGALKQTGATISRSRRATIQEMDRIFEQRTDGIYSDLSREQRDLLFRIQQHVGGVPYARYFSSQSLSGSLNGPLRRNPQVIEGHLAIFAVRGLIIPVSREEQTADTGEFVFSNAYRLPMKDRHLPLEAENGEPIVSETGERIFSDEDVPGDATRLRELERLASRLETDRAVA